MGYEFFIARRYLRAKSRERFVSVITVISVCGVLIGVAALTVVLSMMNGFEKEIRSRIVGISGHITIYRIHSEGLTNHQVIQNQLARTPHMLASAPFVYYKAAISSAADNDGIIVRGVDPRAEQTVTTIGERIIAGDFDFPEQSDTLSGIVVGHGLAHQLQIKLGDPVALFSLRGENLSLGLTQPKVGKFRVTGIFETGMYEYDASLAYIPLARAQSLFETGNTVTGIQVKTDNLFAAKKYAQIIEQNLGPGFYVVDWMEQHKNLFSWMTLEKYAMFVALSLIIAVAAFNIVSSLIMIVLEKRREIGILKSMGATPQNIHKIFVIMGVLIGSVGILLGSGLGYLLCWLQLKFKIIGLPPEIYFINALPIDMRLADFVLVALAAIGISFLATLYPAKRAANLIPIEAIRYQ